MLRSLSQESAPLTTIQQDISEHAERRPVFASHPIRRSFCRGPSAGQDAEQRTQPAPHRKVEPTWQASPRRAGRRSGLADLKNSFTRGAQLEDPCMSSTPGAV